MSKKDVDVKVLTEVLPKEFTNKAISQAQELLDKGGVCALCKIDKEVYGPLVLLEGEGKKTNLSYTVLICKKCAVLLENDPNLSNQIFEEISNFYN